jgi:RHS repeat-associated protein
VSKKVYDSLYSLLATRYFIYDGDRVIEERDASNNLSARYVYGAGIDEPLIMTRGGNSYYYFMDGLGSVTNLLNSTNTLTENYTYDIYGAVSSSFSGVGNPYYFTGRRFDSETGLYYYRARMYDPGIGRFLQRDPLTWAPNDPRLLFLSSLNDKVHSFSAIDSNNYQFLSLSQFFSQFLIYGLSSHFQLIHPYTYSLNNPANLTDPTGEFGFVGATIGFISGLVGGFITGGWQGAAAGSLAGAAVGLINPFASHAVGAAAGAAAASIAGQMTGNLVSGNSLFQNFSAGAVIGSGLGAGLGQGLATAAGAAATAHLGQTAGIVAEGVVSGITTGVGGKVGETVEDVVKRERGKKKK